MTKGGLTMQDLSKGRLIEATDMDLECDLTPRKYLTSLMHLIDSEYFSQSPKVYALEMLDKLNGMTKEISENRES